MTQVKTLPVALVTGANRGIGLEVARQLAHSMTVILGTRDLEKGRAAAETLNSEGFKVLSRKLDVTNQESIDHLVVEVEELGQLNVLINNAGIL